MKIYVLIKVTFDHFRFEEYIATFSTEQELANHLLDESLHNYSYPRENRVRLEDPKHPLGRAHLWVIEDTLR